MPRTGRFRREDRVLESRDFRRAARLGKRRSSKNFSVSIVSSPVLGSSENESDPEVPTGGSPESDQRRLGLTVSRRVGNAVARNRVKRSVREWFRVYRDAIRGDVDVVVIARRGAAGRTTSQVAHELCVLLKLPESS